MKFKQIILFVLVAFPISVLSQVKYSNEFLTVGVGAKALSMGNSVVAAVDDVSSGYWNPAGLIRSDKKVDLSAMHAEYFAGIAKYDYLGASYKIDQDNRFGVSLLRFGIDNIPNTLELIDKDGNIRYDRIETFSSVDFAAILSYAHRTKIEGLNYGVNMKIIRRKTGDFAGAWGFGLDAGIQYDWKNWKFGFMGRDISGTFNAWSFNQDKLSEAFELTGNEIPENSLEITVPRLILGAARLFSLSDSFSLLAEINLNTTLDGERNSLISGGFFSVDPGAGVEVSYKDIVYVRLGSMNFQHIPNYDGGQDLSFQPALGLGLKFRDLCIDYAYTDIGDQSIALYSHVVSLNYSF